VQGMRISYHKDNNAGGMMREARLMAGRRT
jgi:hypothetical protein